MYFVVKNHPFADGNKRSGAFLFILFCQKNKILISDSGENKINDQKMTMLGRAKIQEYLREMVDKGCQIAIVETTSEGIVQFRHRFIDYDTVVLTNLYPEHIESHGGFENYKNAKKKYCSRN